MRKKKKNCNCMDHLPCKTLYSMLGTTCNVCDCFARHVFFIRVFFQHYKKKTQPNPHSYLLTVCNTLQLQKFFLPSANILPQRGSSTAPLRCLRGGQEKSHLPGESLSALNTFLLLPMHTVFSQRLDE